MIFETILTYNKLYETMDLGFYITPSFHNQGSLEPQETSRGCWGFLR